MVQAHIGISCHIIQCNRVHILLADKIHCRGDRIVFSRPLVFGLVGIDGSGQQAINFVRKTDFAEGLFIAESEYDFVNTVFDLLRIGGVEHKAAVRPYCLLVEICGVGAVQMQPDKFRVADGVVFVRLMAVEEAGLPGRGDHGLPAAGNGQAAVADVKKHVVMVVLAFDAIVVVGVIIAAGGHVEQHAPGIFRRRAEIQVRTRTGPGFVYQHDNHILFPVFFSL